MPSQQQMLRFRRRDDYAVELFRDIESHLDDLPRVKRALLELGRFYNPAVDGPIVDLATRRRVVELLEASHDQEARAMLNQRLALYAGPVGESSRDPAGAGCGAEEDGGHDAKLH